MTRLLTAAVCSGASVLLAVGSAFAQEREPNDSRAQADSLAPDERRVASVGSADRDWLVFTAAGSHLVKVSLTNSSPCPLQGELHVGESTDQAKALSLAPGESGAWEFVPYGGSAWYYVQVAGTATDCGDAAYEITASYLAAAATDPHPAAHHCTRAEKVERRARARLAGLRLARQAAKTSGQRRRYSIRIKRQRPRVRKAAAHRVELC